MSRSRRLAKTQDQTEDKTVKSGLQISVVTPLTQNQHRAFNEFYKDRNVAMLGCPGTGKTYLALYLALKAVEDGDFRKVVIFRSAVSGRDQGFMPGNLIDKMAVYESPYQVTVNKLYGRGDAYQLLKNRHIIEFESTSFQRGNTIDDAVVIIDECQNMSFQELHTLTTRLGENCRLLILGDKDQQDLTRDREAAGIDRYLKIIRNTPEFVFITFGVDDIVRSGFVKSYMIQYTKESQSYQRSNPVLV